MAKICNGMQTVTQKVTSVHWQSLVVTQFTIAEIKKTLLLIMLSDGHPRDQSLLGDGKCAEGFKTAFKSCAGKTARHPLHNI